jgi:hypothetical protein
MHNIIPTWQTYPWGGTTRNHLKEFPNEPKVAKSFFWTFFFEMFSQLYIYFSHVYPLHALIYGLKYILEVKGGKC